MLQVSRARRRVRVLTLALLVCLVSACGSPPWSPTPPQAPPAAPPQPPAPPVAMRGELAGTVTINGEARPIVWVEARRPDGFPWAYGTTMPSGSWEWTQMPSDIYDVIIKTPPGFACDARRRPATVVTGQRTIVNFACLGVLNASIAGFTTNEFGTHAGARVALEGPVNRQTTSNGDGFFAFENLPVGDYLVWSCPGRVAVTVKEGETAFATPDCS